MLGFSWTKRNVRPPPLRWEDGDKEGEAAGEREGETPENELVREEMGQRRSAATARHKAHGSVPAPIKITH